MRTIAAGVFKQRCLALLDDVGGSGEPIIITKRGRPVAVLSAVGSEHRDDWRGAKAGDGKILGDLVEPGTPAADWSAERE